MVLDGRGQLVWFHPLTGHPAKYFAANFQVQHYEGHPVLTWWQGVNMGAGEDVIIDTSYRTIATVRAGAGYQADLHEFQITPEGTALLDAVGVKRADLTSVDGPANGAVLDDVIQEVDIKTGRVLWQWHALGHIPLNASYEPYASDELWYDFFHLNSIQQLPDGNLLISARNTWAVYEISRKTGKVIWSLGGKHSSFKLGPRVRFEWQHDARLHPGGLLSLFNDAAGDTPPSESQSSAEVLSVDLAARTVSLIRRYVHSPPLITSASGSAQVLPNGDVFVGWGEQPDFSEYTPMGRQIFTASFPLGIGSYRAFRSPWVGRPHTRPSLAVNRTAGGHVKVYASWNGATQVAAWQVLGGSTAGHLTALGASATRTGFETAIEVRGAPRYLAVEALDGKGRVLGTSAPGRP
jgi:Arylsulfotransferase (ASST)